MERTGKATAAALMAAVMLLAAGCEEEGKVQNPTKPPATTPATPGTPGTKPDKQPAVQPGITTPTTPETTEIKLYFPNDTGDGLGIAKATVPTEDKYTAAVKALVAGTKEPGLTGIFPEGVKVRSVRVENGLATVDFSSELTHRFVGGSTGEQMLVSALVNTLTDFPEVERVLLTVEGRRIETIAGHLDTSEPFTRPTGLVK